MTAAPARHRSQLSEKPHVKQFISRNIHKKKNRNLFLSLNR